MHKHETTRAGAAYRRESSAPRFHTHTFTSIFFTLIIALSFHTSAVAELDIMPVSEVREGMTGHGRTVFRDHKITEFPVLVRGVMPGAGLSGEPLILVELTGGEVDDYGGVSLGMSGSPIFIDGKLIGALSLTFPFTDHSLGGVTPIEAMLQAAEYDDAGGARGEIELEQPLRVGEKIYHRMRHGGPVAADVLVARPAAAPLAVRGISPRAYKYIENKFRESGVEIRPIKGPLGKGMKRKPQEIGPGSELKPGSSVAVQLVTGDVDMSGVGTVTAVDGGMVLMFGHPFFRKGAVNYLLADARVLAIVQGDDMPFKVTDTGTLRGSVTQDRGSALVGRLDVYPPLIPLEIVSRDRDIGREKVTRVKIVRDEDIMPNLVLMVILEALDNTIDKIGEGTANIRFTLKATGYDGEITRENMYYDRYDISAQTLSELVDLLLILNDNRFFESTLSGLKILVEMDSSRSVAVIEKAELLNRKKSEITPPDAEDTNEIEVGEMVGGAVDSVVRGEAILEVTDEYSDLDDEDDMPVVYPGDRLELGVRIRPFRRDPVEETLFIKVPHDIPYGKALINVFSGTRDMPAVTPGGFIIEVKVEGPDEREQVEDGMIEGDEGEESFDEMVQEFMGRDLNNELVATIESISFNAHDISEEESEPEKDISPAHDSEAKKRTNWVLNGSTSMKVLVEMPGGGLDTFKTRSIKKSTINSLKND